MCSGASRSALVAVAALDAASAEGPLARTDAKSGFATPSDAPSTRCAACSAAGRAASLASAAAELAMGNASNVVALATGAGADVLALAVLAAALGAVLAVAVLIGSVATGPAAASLPPLVGKSAGTDSGPTVDDCAGSSASGWMAEGVAGAGSPRDCVLAGGAGTTTPADTSTPSLTGGDRSTLARG